MGLTNKLTMIADGFRSSNGITEKLSLNDMAKLARQGSKLIEDIPTTPGQWACLARASQMRDIKYTPKADMYAAVEDSRNLMTAGTEYTGIVYSSVRALDWGFIGYGVSMYSYLTALNNPKSIIYTKKYTDYFSLSAEEDPDNKANSLVYNVYGTNCSDYVSYCLGLPYLLTTNVIPTLSNVIEICYDEATQTVDTNALQKELQLCDLMGGINEHIEIITGIRRDSNGFIREVDSSDSWTPRIRKTTYTWNEFVDYLTTEGYRFHRYADLDKVDFPENLTDIVYSDIVTNRGDKISIRPNQDISLNVLNVGDYAGIALFKDGVQVSKQESTDDWELNNLTTGKYTAILYKSGETVTIDHANETNSTTFIVCDVSVSRSGNTYTYTADAINGVFPTPVQITLKNKYGFTFTATPIEDGNFAGTGNIEIVCEGFTPSMITCPFRTEYGFVIAENVY